MVDAAPHASMLDPIALFLMADWVVKTVMIGLVIASLWSWAVILDKAFKFAALNRQANAFENDLNSGRSLEDMASQAGRTPPIPCRACWFWP